MIIALILAVLLSLFGASLVLYTKHIRKLRQQYAVLLRMAVQGRAGWCDVHAFQKKYPYIF